MSLKGIIEKIVMFLASKANRDMSDPKLAVVVTV